MPKLSVREARHMSTDVLITQGKFNLEELGGTIGLPYDSRRTTTELAEAVFVQLQTFVLDDRLAKYATVVRNFETTKSDLEATLMLLRLDPDVIAVEELTQLRAATCEMTHAMRELRALVSNIINKFGENLQSTE